MMPKELLEFARIDDSLMFVGLGRGFQVWEPEAYKAHRDAARKRAKEQGATLRIVRRDEDGGGRS